MRCIPSMAFSVNLQQSYSHSCILVFRCVTLYEWQQLMLHRASSPVGMRSGVLVPWYPQVPQQHS